MVGLSDVPYNRLDDDEPVRAHPALRGIAGLVLFVGFWLFAAFVAGILVALAWWCFLSGWELVQ